jgi:sec-independent protein translocase protein TatA
MPSLGPLEIVVIAVVALLVFGPNRLPEVGRQVGRAMRELRKFQDSVRDELHGVMSSMDATGGVEPAPPTLPPVVGPQSTSVGDAVPGPPRSSAPPRPGGAHAPSRFRPSAPPAPPAPSSASRPAPAPAHPRGVHAPSRFRTPRR